MKSKDIQQLRGFSKEELLTRASELESQKRTLFVGKFTKPAKNTREIRTTRQKLAVIYSLLREKEFIHE